MTTTFFLVRHAAHDRVGTILCGRMPGVHLGAVGKAQAERLAVRFSGEDVACIRTSPLERHQLPIPDQFCRRIRRPCGQATETDSRE